MTDNDAEYLRERLKLIHTALEELKVVLQDIDNRLTDLEQKYDY